MEGNNKRKADEVADPTEQQVKYSMCRWGILGTANIAKKNIQAIRGSGNGSVDAVASRNLERAQTWAEEQQIPKAYGSYEELLEDTDIDAVYIPLPTALHKEWTIKAAKKGKHILCEKPVARNATEVQEMIEACKTAQVQFMDGVMFMHHTRLASIEKIIRDVDSFGDLIHVNTMFTFNASPSFLAENIRTHPDTEPLGCLGDLAWYCVRLALWVYNYELPTSVTCVYNRTSARGGEVPTSCSGTLQFSEGKTSSFHCAFHGVFTQNATIQGTKQRIEMEDFVLETQPDLVQYNLVTDAQHFHTKVRTVSEQKKVEGCCQQIAMAKMFASLVLKIKEGSDPDMMWGDFSLLTQNVLDACVESAKQSGKLITLP